MVNLHKDLPLERRKIKSIFKIVVLKYVCLDQRDQQQFIYKKIEHVCLN